MEKNKRTGTIVLLVFAAILILGLCVFFWVNRDQHDEAEAGSKLLKIAAVSDLHIAAKDPSKEDTKDDINLKMMDALLMNLKKESVDVLILSGDNTNSSRTHQHEALAQKLYEIEQSGITVIIVPGNHDIGTMTKEEFAPFYKDFGYSEAYARDENSLSYSYLISDTLILMLDTEGYTDYHYAGFTDATVSWIKEQLEDAKVNNRRVISVGHFPMLTRHSTTFLKKDETATLFKEYNMPLYICGHLHNRNVTRDGSLTELVLEKMTGYPCSYALFEEKDDNSLTYTPKVIDIPSWAQEINSTDETLLKFNTNAQAAMKAQCKETVELIGAKQGIPIDELGLAVDFFEEVMVNLYSGTVYRNLDALKNHPGYAQFEAAAVESNYGPWVPAMFESCNPYTEGFELSKNGNIIQLGAD